MTDIRRCDQCGREGGRGFRLIGGWYDARLNETSPRMTVCSNVNACRKRWPCGGDVTVQPNGCWFVVGTIQKKRGYCTVYVPAPVKRQYLAHRLAYEAFVGPIPDGAWIDHTCHNADTACPGGIDDCKHKRCCNPDHLEATSPSLNTERGMQRPALALKPRNWRRNRLPRHAGICRHGHRDAYVERPDPQGKRKRIRYCGECMRIRAAERWQRTKANRPYKTLPGNEG